MQLTLLSDFGLSDSYVGVMKGVIAQINPDLTVIDLTHQIPPQDIATARFQLMTAYPYFPVGTVHVAVVDPGVGGMRRAIALELEQGWLVGPDNGLFSGVLSQFSVFAAVELTNPQYWRIPAPSRTFHGRDIFASVGAHLASGVPLISLGRSIDPATLVRLDLPALTQHSEGATYYIQGCIQAIDHFGNLITNISSQSVQGRGWQIQVGETSYVGKTTYADGQPGEIIALIGSHGWIEIAVTGGSARAQLQCDWGALVIVRVEPNSSDLARR